jgi:hypothetical protein
MTSSPFLLRLLIGLALVSPVLAKDKSGDAGAGGAVFDFGRAPAEQADTFVEVTRGGNLKKIQKLAIVNFTVEFMLTKHLYVAARAKALDWEKANQQIDLPKLDLTAVQGIADALYDQLVADLAATGLEVIPFATLSASKHFAKLKGAQHETPWLLDNPDTTSVFIGAHGMPIYVDNPKRFEGSKAIGAGLQALLGTNTRLHEVMLCNEFKANLLSVNLVVDFGDLQTGRFFTDIKTTFGHYLQAKNSRFRFAAVGQPEFAYLTLKQRLESGNVPLRHGESTTKTTSGVLESLNPNGTITRETTTKVYFDQELYTRDTGRLVRAANAVFIATFAKERGTAAPASTTQPIE